MIEFTTDTANLNLFWSRVKKFNHKAAQLGLDIFVEPAFSAPYRVEERDQITGLVTYAYDAVDIQIPDVEIRLPGNYRFVAVVEHLGSEGNLINRSPLLEDGIEIPAEYRTAEPTCDHCGIIRLRNTTIVVQNESGEFKRVGSTCAKGYLGIPASKLVTLWGLLGNVTRDDYGTAGEAGTSALTFLTTVAAVISKYGWMSKGVAREYDKIATADIAWSVLFDRKGHVRDLYPELFNADGSGIYLADEFEAQAVEALEWLTDEIDPESNDYFWNLSVAVRNGFVNGRRAGIVASLIGVHQREMGKRAEREAQIPSTHFGDVKSRYEITAEVLYTNIQDGYAYGTYDIFAILKDAEGHVFWTSTGTLTEFGTVLEDADKGDTITFKATVKAHDTNRDNQEITKLTRCKPV